MADSMAKRAYNYLKLDVMDQEVAAMMLEETNLFSAHAKVFKAPYRSFLAFGYQGAAVFLHLARLIKNIVFLFGTLLLALAASFSDWNVARELAITAAGRAFLVALNLTNTVFALVSVVVNAFAIPVHKALKTDLNEKAIQDNQKDLAEKVYNGFFKSIKPVDDPDNEEMLSTKSALNSVAGAFSLPTIR